MFNDDGLGEAMALAGARDDAKNAVQRTEILEARVAQLERYVSQLQYIVYELSKRGQGAA